ncbi:hypothetical protein D3C83_164410 [compost metagenome]
MPGSPENSRGRTPKRPSSSQSAPFSNSMIQSRATNPSAIFIASRKLARARSELV